MFHVLVLGGIALTACGGAVTTSSRGTDSGSGEDAFPQEGPAQVDAFPTETAQQVDAFPSESPCHPPSCGGPVEAGPDVDSGPTDAPFDSGIDTSCFPQETALADAGCITPQGD